MEAKKKPILSIVVPAVPGRLDRLKCVCSRLSLNMYRHPDIPIEIIIVDGSEHGEYRSLHDAANAYLPLKYVCLPIGKFINAGYPRNVGFRLAEGRILTQVDIDWYLGEDFIAGAMEPFMKGINALNNGYMIDTNTSKMQETYGPDYLEALNDLLLDQKRGMDKEILGVFHAAKIPSPKRPESIWLWAAPRQAFFALGGYDEKYCRRWAYTREDCDMFWRFVAAGLKRYGEAFNTFCGMHLWHSAGQRSNEQNQMNKDYYNKMNKDDKGNIVIKEKVRNVGHQWGKLLRFSYTIIENRIRDFYETELWIQQNNEDVPCYMEKEPWQNIDAFVAAVD